MIEMFFIVIGIVSCFMGFLYVAIIMLETLILRFYQALFKVMEMDTDYKHYFPKEEVKCR